MEWSSSPDELAKLEEFRDGNKLQELLTTVKVPSRSPASIRLPRRSPPARRPVLGCTPHACMWEPEGGGGCDDSWEVRFCEHRQHALSHGPAPRWWLQEQVVKAFGKNLIDKALIKEAKLVCKVVSAKRQAAMKRILSLFTPHAPKWIFGTMCLMGTECMWGFLFGFLQVDSLLLPRTQPLHAWCSPGPTDPASGTPTARGAMAMQRRCNVCGEVREQRRARCSAKGWMHLTGQRVGCR